MFDPSNLGFVIFFLKEMIKDAILTCYSRGADPKACRLWYKINEGTRITVRTEAGMSKFANVGTVVGQGTLGGALVSQAVLDREISEQFAPGGEDELTYGSVPMAPFIFQDDVLHAAEGLLARSEDCKCTQVVKSLKLTLNKDKTFLHFNWFKKAENKNQGRVGKNSINVWGHRN